ncbi:50S ribosomal protein L11 [Candidatus Pacearchaeota archaeon]|nr:50S ribosomal protein L11 [Candidatus Pacearchaeota archaeon]
MQIKLLVEGGNAQPGPAISQKLGPTGVNVNQVMQKVNEATKNFKGLKVPVEVELDLGTKEIEVKVFSPPVSELLKREAGIEKGSGAQLKLKAANLSIEQVISVSKTKLPNLLANNLRAALKSVVGTCGTLGFLIEGKLPTDVQLEINEGKYDKEISEEITETPEEKKQQLQDSFKKLDDAQQKMIKQEEAQKAEKEKKEIKKEDNKAEKLGVKK